METLYEVLEKEIESICSRHHRKYSSLFLLDFGVINLTVTKKWNIINDIE